MTTKTNIAAATVILASLAASGAAGAQSLNGISQQAIDFQAPDESRSAAQRPANVVTRLPADAYASAVAPKHLHAPVQRGGRQ